MLGPKGGTDKLPNTILNFSILFWFFNEILKWPQEPNMQLSRLGDCQAYVYKRKPLLFFMVHWFTLARVCEYAFFDDTVKYLSSETFCYLELSVTYFRARGIKFSYIFRLEWKLKKKQMNVSQPECPYCFEG